MENPNTSTLLKGAVKGGEGNKKRGKGDKDILKPQPQGLPQLPHPILGRGLTQQSLSFCFTGNILTLWLSYICLHRRISDEDRPEPIPWIHSYLKKKKKKMALSPNPTT